MSLLRPSRAPSHGTRADDRARTRAGADVVGRHLLPLGHRSKAVLSLASLAGLLIVTAWVMSEPHRWPDRLRAPWSDQFLLFVTFGLTMFSDLTVAIAVGTALGLGQRLLSRGEPPANWTPPER